LQASSLLIFPKAGAADDAPGFNVPRRCGPWQQNWSKSPRVLVAVDQHALASGNISSHEGTTLPTFPAILLRKILTSPTGDIRFRWKMDCAEAFGSGDHNASSVAVNRPISSLHDFHLDAAMQPTLEESMQSNATLLSSTRNQRTGRLTLLLLAAAGLLLAPAVSLAGGNGNGGGGSNTIWKVEEDWEADIGTPNTNLGSPQLTFLISTTTPSDGNPTGYYAVLTMNQRDGAVGGLELTLYNGSSQLTRTTFSNTSKLSSSGEKIQWTTRMTLSNNTLTVEAFNTHGSTNAWGNFDITASATVSGLSDLNSYDITGNTSGNNSGVDFGNARVSKLVVQAIRTYTGTGNNTKTTSQLGAAKTIYSYP
jgi:hypothetical protein